MKQAEVDLEVQGKIKRGDLYRTNSRNKRQNKSHDFRSIYIF